MKTVLARSQHPWEHPRPKMNGRVFPWSTYREGISHHYAENTEDDDIVLGCQVLADAAAEILTVVCWVSRRWVEPGETNHDRRHSKSNRYASSTCCVLAVSHRCARSMKIPAASSPVQGSPRFRLVSRLPERKHSTALAGVRSLRLQVRLDEQLLRQLL